MNKFIAITALILSACAAADDGEPTTQTVTTGTAEQAATFTLHRFHGIVNSGPNVHQRCNHNAPNYNSSNPCIHPPRRNLGFNVDSASCGADDISVRGGLQIAANYANARGWSIAEVASGGTIFVKCVCNAAVTSGALGVTRYTGIPGSTLIPYSKAEIFVDLCRIRADATYTGATAAGKKNVVTNVASHELGHSLGMGHQPGPAGGCSNDLMLARASNACLRTLALGFDSTESAMLTTFDVD